MRKVKLKELTNNEQILLTSLENIPNNIDNVQYVIHCPLNLKELYNICKDSKFIPLKEISFMLIKEKLPEKVLLELKEILKNQIEKW